MAQDDAAEQPVLGGDGNAATFGMGNLVYPDGDTAGFLTYSPSNRYILSAAFCSDLPLAASLLRNAGDSWGRDFPGQVLKQIGGKTYILIGNAQQLEAIGTDAKVYTAVYQAKLSGVHWEVDQDDDGNPIMLYGGDADLLQSQNGKKNYPFGEDGIEEAEGALTGRCGVNQDTGEIDPNMDIEDSGATYSAGANYIVFRDIDLNDLNGTAGASNWSPLTFSGAMIGAKAEKGEALWDETASNITATGRPIISNLRVIQDTSLDVGETMGLGFFATLQSNTGKVTGGTETESFGSTGAVTVSGLILQSPMVYTLTTETHYDQTLINGLLSGLGTLVGGVLDGLLAILGIRIGLRDVLTNLLDARKADPTALATGAWPGAWWGRCASKTVRSSTRISRTTIPPPAGLWAMGKALPAMPPRGSEKLWICFPAS